MSSDVVDELPTDVVKDCSLSVEFPLDKEIIQSTSRSTNDLAFSLNTIHNDSLGGKRVLENDKQVILFIL